MEREKGAHWTLIGFLEQCKILVILHLTDLVLQKKVKMEML
jgi:hypothetical protein